MITLVDIVKWFCKVLVPIVYEDSSYSPFLATVGINLFIVATLKKIFMFIFEREREREKERERQSMSRGGAERQNLQQAPGSELSAQSPTQGSNS